MPASDPRERTLQARVAAFDSWAQTSDRTARTAPARSAFDNRFLDEVDPDRVLPEVERNMRAEAARRAYFARLALQSAKSRRLASTP